MSEISLKFGDKLFELIQTEAQYVNIAKNGTGVVAPRSVRSMNCIRTKVQGSIRSG